MTRSAPMITGQLSKPLLSLRGDMEAADMQEDGRGPSSDSETNDEPLLLPPDTDADDKLYGGRDGSVQSDASSSTSEQGPMSHPAYPVGPQSLLVAQQLASAVSGVMSGGAPGLNQPILIPFNAGGHLGGQQGLVLSLPTAANIQGLVAAATAGGIMTLPLQNLQGSCWCSTPARLAQPSAEGSPGQAGSAECRGLPGPGWLSRVPRAPRARLAQPSAEGSPGQAGSAECRGLPGPGWLSRVPRAPRVRLAQPSAEGSPGLIRVSYSDTWILDVFPPVDIIKLFNMCAGVLFTAYESGCAEQVL
ncbi:hypothetical protein P4O66_000069 [Electrophorus voltai]|uniref:POU class 6 homeobox 2 n=1 Tax=Electrophorus voltai TaxID=2609070 RepID=A0AAD9E8W7_9TELE|nr:hypothetical protein P4O66_000069 [Electrophorus voltai]